MNFVGFDLHKKSISICVVIQEAGKRRISQRCRFVCDRTEQIQAFFDGLGSYQVVEATASYEWFVQLVERTAEEF